MQIVIILISSLLGILVRVLVDKLFSVVEKGFPWKALLLNILGCAFAAFLFLYFRRDSLSFRSELVYLFAFCLGFSIFSAHAVRAVKNYRLGIAPATYVFFMVSPSVGALGAFVVLFI